MVSVKLDNIWMSFGGLTVLKGISLDIGEGEFLTLLGPSGCGKTTLLRIIAGLYRPVKGRVLFDGRDVTGLPPWERNIGFVFQDYALWPHMTVFDNVAYGLRIRRVPRDEVRERVEEVLALVGLEGLGDRYPHQLSGGQQQRVALARAIVINPSLLLLDEPLSNLDAKIRVSVRGEIRKLQKRLKITTIYVTHDQEEALVISDRIAVVNKGVVEQVDDPWSLYYHPKTLFVADFIGQVNMVEGRVAEAGEGSAIVETGMGAVAARLEEEARAGDKVYLVFRPENVEVSREKPDGANVYGGVVGAAHFLGNILRVEVAVGGETVKAEIHNPLKRGVLKPGEKVFVSVDPDSVLALKRASRVD